MNAASRYLLRVTLTGVIAAAFIAALTIAVDPYRVFGTPVVKGLTDIKPRIYQQTQMAKGAQMERIRPKTVCIGNSRVDIGLDPSSSGWPAAMRPVFNAAEDGSGLYDAWRMLQDATALHTVRTAVLAVDFFDFLRPDTPPDTELPPPTQRDFRLRIRRDGSANPDRALQVWRDRLQATLTLDALVDSVWTLFAGDSATGVNMTPQGLNPLNNYKAFAQRSGYGVLFAQKNKLYARQYGHSVKPEFLDPSLNASFRMLERIIATAEDNDIRLVLFVPPYHADLLKIINDVGLWPSFEAWKSALARVADMPAEHGAERVTVVDFSGFNRYTTERVPPPGDTKSMMRFYWESGHFKRELGDRVIRRLFGTSDWGRDLTPASTEGVIRAVREERNAYFTGAELGTGAR